MPDLHAKMLLVEGPDDGHFVYHVCERLGLGVVPREGVAAPEHVLILPAGDVQRVGSALHGLLDQATVAVVGVIVDHDDPDNIAAQEDRWEMLRGTLLGKGYDAPEELRPDGLVLEHGGPAHPRVGVWIMPDKQTPGMLETFVQQLVREGDGLMAHARSVVAGLPSPREFSDAHTAKAETHTYLAWQKTPGLPMGQALKQRVYSLNTPAGQAFAA